MNERFWIETNINGSMTPVAFIEECIDDVTQEKIIEVIQNGGFQRNNESITDPQQEVEFIVGDKIIFELDNLAFTII